MEIPVLVQRDGAIATVVLNRPEKLNAINRAMWQRARANRSRRWRDDPSVRCIVMRGAGTKAFAPGADISEFERERSNVAQAHAYGEVMRRTIEAIDGCPAPGGRDDPRHLRRRRPRGRGPRGPAHLRRVEPLRRAHREARPHHGLPRDRRAGAPRGRGHRARDPPRRPRLRRARGAGEGARHARGARRPRSRAEALRHARGASPKARRWSRAGTRSSRAACAATSRSPPTSTTRASPASAPTISRRAIARSWKRGNPLSKASN